MTLEEKISFIEENKNKKYLYVSPRIIQGGANLVRDYETLELYENMDENTMKFAEREIVNLVSGANNSQEANKDLEFNLVFCGGFDDLPNPLGNHIDFIKNNKEKMVAVYRYLKGAQVGAYFRGIPQTIYNYDYVYLNFQLLLEEFKKNNIECSIDLNINNVSHLYNDATTRLMIQYNPNKDKVLTKSRNY